MGQISSRPTTVMHIPAESSCSAMLEKPELIQEARPELDRRLDGESYKCLIPKEVKPHYFD